MKASPLGKAWSAVNLSARSLFLVHGSEDYILQQFVSFVENLMLDNKEPIGGLISLDENDQVTKELYFGTSFDLNSFTDSLQTLPMFSTKKIVLIRETEKIKAAHWPKINLALSNDLGETVVIFYSNKLDKRKKIYKSLFEKSFLIPADKPQDKDLSKWVDYFFEIYNLVADKATKTYFLSLIGNSLYDLMNESLKLSLFKLRVEKSNDKIKISMSDIGEVTLKIKQDNIFDLTKALGRGNKVAAVNLIHQILAQGENELGVLALIARHIRILKKVKYGLAQRFSRQALASAAGVPSFFIENYIEQSRSWGFAKLTKAQSDILNIDVQIKRTTLDKKCILEEFIYNLCS